MLLYSLIGAALGAGTSAPSGLFIPMLLIGACLGRCMGIGLVAVAHALHLPLIGEGSVAVHGVVVGAEDMQRAGVLLSSKPCWDVLHAGNVLHWPLLGQLSSSWM